MQARGAFAVNARTYQAIQQRFSALTPKITLSDYIVDNPSMTDLEVEDLTLQGVTFNVKNPDDFILALKRAKVGNQPAFKEGGTKDSDWKDHWAFSASLLATSGIGFRELWREADNGRLMQMRNAQPPSSGSPNMDNDFSANFGAANSVNYQALHVAVAFGKFTRCNVHIDETGITMADRLNQVTITPNVINHFANELIFKTILGGNLPSWVLDRVNLQVMSPEVGYKRIGVSVDLVKGDDYKISVMASCGLTHCADVDFTKIVKLDTNAIKQLNPTINFSGRFKAGGG